MKSAAAAPELHDEQPGGAEPRVPETTTTANGDHNDKSIGNADDESDDEIVCAAEQGAMNGKRLTTTVASGASTVPSAPADFSVQVHDDNREGSTVETETYPEGTSSSNTYNSQIPLHGVGKDDAEAATVETSPRSSRRRRQEKRLRGARSRMAPVENSITHYSKSKSPDKFSTNKEETANGIAEAPARTTAVGLPTPANQYECTLTRRAVLPIDPNLSPTERAQLDPDVYGDLSLGMKLSVAENGDVIVQRVIALQDGRASPAQLTGLIRRGDILLAIDGVNLSGGGGSSLSGLNALKAPEDPTVPCQRAYRVRLAAAEGLEQLNRMEDRERERVAYSSRPGGAPPRLDPASEMLALFPMVDQLSGMPYFENADPARGQQQADNSAHINENNSNTANDNNSRGTQDTEITKKSELSLLKRKAIGDVDIINKQISEHLAQLRAEDRRRYLLRRWSHPTARGGYRDFEYNYDNVLDLHGFDSDNRSEIAGDRTEQLLTLPQRQEVGRRGLVGARNLLKQVENIDAGKDLRSFQNWNTTLSLYSRASTRRRRVFDAASLPLNFGKVDENEDEDDNDGGQSSTNSEKVDGDELLLRLAAHDVIWRKQVIEFLEKVAQEWEKEDDEDNPKEEKTGEGNDLNAAMSIELGNFLFGENMTQILAKNKKPRSLPSEEVTAVLFDLATELSASVPGEIKATESTMSNKSGLTPFTGFKRQQAGSDVLLATRFLLDEALPAWLKSFRPLVWEHRRILWPLNRILVGGSTAGSTLSDELTLDSTSMRSTTRTSPQQRLRKSKTIREIIEDQELNVETRSETCFLVTYYFIHAMLPRLMRAKKEVGPDSDKGKDEIVVFMGEYGSYLKMDTCLAYAAVLKADSVVDILLSIAKYDPRHREVIKQTSKSASMVFYEPSMLSAVVQLLYEIQKETNRERRRAIIDLATAAYPDLRPWQTKKACDVSRNTQASEAFREEMKSLYYTYLTLLLDPTDGHDAARRDPALVKEWCELSVNELVNSSGLKVKEDCRKNFFYVASRASSHHLAYHRDLLLLLSLSMDIKENSLALDLAGEIIDNPIFSRVDSNLLLVLNVVRRIGLLALDLGGNEDQNARNKTFKRVLRLFEKPEFRRVVDVPHELLNFLKHRAGKSSIDCSVSHILELIEFVAEEAIPSDVLKCMTMIDARPGFHPELLPVLHTLLKRGASSGNELSASLLRIKQSRRRLEGRLDSHVDELTRDSDLVSQKIWKKMASGMVSIEK